MFNKYLLINCLFIISQSNSFWGGWHDELWEEMRSMEKYLKHQQKQMTKYMENIERDVESCCVSGESLQTNFKEIDNLYVISISVPEDVTINDIKTNYIDGKALITIENNNNSVNIKTWIAQHGYRIMGQFGYVVSNKEGNSRASSIQHINQSSTFAQLVDIKSITIEFDKKHHTLNINLPHTERSQFVAQEIPITEK
jgi:hypothetical protein